MRFKTELKNIRTFSKLVAAISSLEKIAWMRLDQENARFTVIPDTGSQVWASLSMDLIFENYQIQSAEPNNTINLELPLLPLQRALKSALNSVSTTLRLTKKDGIPVLSMTITTTTTTTSNFGGGGSGASAFASTPAPRSTTGPSLGDPDLDTDDPFADPHFEQEALSLVLRREREKIITQDIPVRVLHPETVESIMQPHVREADVNIQLPPLLQLKAISDRFTKLAMTGGVSSTSRGGGGLGAAGAGGLGGSTSPKLELSATMHGSLRLRSTTEALEIESLWSGLENPELDPAQISGPLEEVPSWRYKQAGPDKWATVRVDGKDWSRVLSVGRLDGRVIACFCHDHALILYVYVTSYDDAAQEDSVVTYYVSSYSL